MKDKRFLPAFYLAVRDTLVAETLEQASRLAYGTTKRFRVVTLEGQLIEASGTMSGGAHALPSQAPRPQHTSIAARYC